MGSLTRSLRRSVAMLVMLSLLAATLAVGVTAAQGQRGNSDAAALCQGEGYKSLTRQDGTPFANAGDCIRYAARNGVTAIVTAVPTIAPPPGPIVVKPTPGTIRITPPPLVTPTPAPVTTTWLTLSSQPKGTCSALALATGLEPGTGYIIAMHVSYEGGEPEVREVEVPTSHHTYFSYRVHWFNIYGPKEVYAYLYEIQGEELVLVNQAGPLILDEECADPVN